MSLGLKMPSTSKTSELPATILTYVLYLAGISVWTFSGAWSAALCASDVERQQQENAISDFWSDEPTTYQCDSSSFSIVILLCVLLALGLLASSIWAAIELGKAAEIKNLSKSGFTFLGLLFPIIALIILMSTKTDKKDIPVPLEPGGKIATLNGTSVAECPHCAEYIKLAATICRYCDRSVEEEFKQLRSQLGID